MLTAIGWRSLAADSEVPFDEARCVVPTGKGGRVIAEAAQNSDDAPPFVKGLYAAGWLRRGPSGIIGTNISDGHDVAAAILEDSAEGLLRDGMKDEDIGGGDAVIAAVASRIEGVDSLVEWTGHLRIDAAEVAAGLSKVRLFASCSALCIKNLTQHQIHYVSIVILREQATRKNRHRRGIAASIPRRLPRAMIQIDAWARRQVDVPSHILTWRFSVPLARRSVCFGQSNLLPLAIRTNAANNSREAHFPS